MQNNASLAEIAAVFHARNRFVVMSHARPDGDALGCTLATALCLKQLGKDVTAWNEDGVPEKFRYLPGAEMVQRPPAEGQRFDVAVVLDNAVKNRAGKAVEAVAHADVWINIDHHITNAGYGDLSYIDATAPATGQILFELFRGQNLPLTYAMADNLFVAISTDTGSFQYPSTTARTYEIGADLIRAGVDVGTLSQKMYESYPRRRLELLRALLNVLRFSSKDRVASFALSAEITKSLGIQPDDSEGLIDYIRAIDGVMVAGFFEEVGDGRVRVSLRSKSPKISVSKICGLFGGGGHTLAAGARVTGSLAEVQEKVLQAIDHEFDQP
ncbi:MAG: bifunctional oligoribonuclease/PAP phosphatase NrnA [Chthoniobacter sp.]|uniref:DHH family phosphoesterase n=1 Tax=Chthoniobacter sp. TaxID=2510640 RepID=UPI0032A9D26A